MTYLGQVRELNLRDKFKEETINWNTGETVNVQSQLRLAYFKQKPLKTKLVRKFKWQFNKLFSLSVGPAYE